MRERSHEKPGWLLFLLTQGYPLRLHLQAVSPSLLLHLPPDVPIWLTCLLSLRSQLLCSLNSWNFISSPLHRSIFRRLGENLISYQFDHVPTGTTGSICPEFQHLVGLTSQWTSTENAPTLLFDALWPIVSSTHSGNAC